MSDGFSCGPWVCFQEPQSWTTPAAGRGCCASWGLWVHVPSNAVCCHELRSCSSLLQAESWWSWIFICSNTSSVTCFITRLVTMVSIGTSLNSKQCEGLVAKVFICFGCIINIVSRSARLPVHLRHINPVNSSGVVVCACFSYFFFYLLHKYLTECDVYSHKYACVCVHANVCDELYANAVLWFAVFPLLCWSEAKQLPRLLCLQLLPNCPAIKLLYVYSHSTEEAH